MGEITASGLLFEEIGEAHLAEVLDIYNYYVLNTTVTFHTDPQSLPEMRQSVLSGDPRFKSYVIMQDGEMLGYVLIARHKNKQAYDTSGEISIYLKPGCGGRGLGGHALRFIEERAAELRFHVLVATVCADNEPSHAVVREAWIRAECPVQRDRQQVRQMAGYCQLPEDHWPAAVNIPYTQKSACGKDEFLDAGGLFMRYRPSSSSRNAPVAIAIGDR